MISPYNQHNQPDVPWHLFTLSIWRARGSGGETEWCGLLQHVLSGETRPLDNWAELPALLIGMLPAWDAPLPAAGETGRPTSREHAARFAELGDKEP